MESAGAVPIAFLDEGASSPELMALSAALAQAVNTAAALSVGKESFAISFHSLLIGLIATPDDTGHWLREQFQRSGADLAGVLGRRRLKRDDLEELSRAPEQPQPLTRTASGRQALDEAQRIAQAASRPTGTADLLTALLSLPAFHDSDFRAHGIDREAWIAAFRAEPSLTVDRPLDLGAPDIEPQVREALRLADALAGSAPIAPAHVIAAIRLLAPHSHSPAFKRFTQIAPAAAPVSSGAPAGKRPEAARLDPDLHAQLTRAQRSTHSDASPFALWGRDLITAALLCPDAALRPSFTASGLDLDSVRDRWYAFVTQDEQHRPLADWAAWWREAGIALPGPRRAGYARETDEGTDRLGVDLEAQAFARLILDTAVEPPLSIGLLGDWGSGKSFFIQQIRQSIAALRAENRPELHSRVVEIEFNAWHASDANLWASLVTNIFDEIWRKVAPASANGDPQAVRERLQKQIEQARGAVHEAETQVQLGQQALELAERALKAKRELLAWNKVVTSISTARLQALMTNAGWHPAIETINDVEDSARALAASGTQLRTLGAALLERPVWSMAVPTGAVLSLTAIVWLLVAQLPDAAAQVSKALTAVAGAVGALIAPLKLARSKVDRLTTALKDIKTQYDTQLAASTDPVKAEAISSARRELKSAEASVAAARTRLAELLNQQATLDPTRRLGAFLQERVQSTQYRSQQGLISLVHKDFSELSKYMKDLRDAAPSTDAKGDADPDAIRPFDRIVLYVDDLDRCRPAHVVNMLEAVHLLLALDLFVVVVAVDSRWLTRALEVHYQELLGSSAVDADGLRASTPQSYLEKIFQITYALAPMKPERFGEYVASLAGGEVTAPKSSSTPAPQHSSNPGDDSNAPATPEPLTTDDAAPAAAARASSGSAATGQKTQKTPRRASSPPVHISAEERAFIVRLVPLLPTPRIAKRLVNVYRVIKAQKTVEALEAFEQEGQAANCLLMLALLLGRPGVAASLLRTLHEAHPPFDNPAEPLVAAMRRRSFPDERTPALARLHREWTELTDTLAAMGIAQDVGDCAAQTREVARYSLVTGHDWHTWAAPTIGPP